jgi:transposase
MIGVDPHKASHTAVAIGRDEGELGVVKVRATRSQVTRLSAWAEPFEKRTWAIESARGLGYLLAQQLVAAGEDVLDVPATLASRIPLLGSGRTNKERPQRALAVALAALRAPALRPVEMADHAEVLRLLAKRNTDIGNQRTRVVCRLHALLAELAPGGIAKELNVSDGVALLARICPQSEVERARHELAVGLLDDVRRLDAQLKESHRRIRSAVRASSTTLTDLFGVEPILACILIGYTGDMRRFRNRDQFAAYNCPLAVGSCTASRGAATASSTTPSISRRCHPSLGDLSDPPAAFRRTRLLRPQSRRGQDQERSAALWSDRSGILQAKTDRCERDRRSDGAGPAGVGWVDADGHDRWQARKAGREQDGVDVHGAGGRRSDRRAGVAGDARRTRRVLHRCARDDAVARRTRRVREGYAVGHGVCGSRGEVNGGDVVGRNSATTAKAAAAMIERAGE